MMASSCASVHIKDAEVCGDMGKDGATCFHTLTSATRDISEPEWDNTRFGWVCTDANNFAGWKADIEQLCHQTNNCTYDVQSQIKAFFDKIDKLKKP